MMFIVKVCSGACMSLKMRALALYGSVSSPINNLWLNVCLSDSLVSTAGITTSESTASAGASVPFNPDLYYFVLVRRCHK